MPRRALCYLLLSWLSLCGRIQKELVQKHIDFRNVANDFVRGLGDGMKDIDHECTDEIVCPYCWHESSDSYEYFPRGSDSNFIECCECGKHFRGDAYYSVIYSTRKVPCLNNEGEHKWSEWFDTGVAEKKRRYCRFCDKVENV